MRRRTREPEQPVYSITSLPTSMEDDQRARVHSYLLSMGIRTLAFIVAGTCVALGWTAWAWVCLLAAVVLPYPAVVLANAAANRKSHFMEAATPLREIGTAEDHRVDTQSSEPDTEDRHTPGHDAA